ncbi:MAG: response regulator [Candidatus Zixiibacteriota bacterium]|nr:MAG: response regulator [candidate division Zixibacteria bacterium]
MDNNEKKIRLLLVDDEADFRQATSQGLSRRGFDVMEAASGEESLEIIGKTVPEIVLLDQKMPGLSGIETLQKIRETNPSLPVIILTGHGDYQTALAGIKFDIIDFMQKPVDIDQLADHIRSLLEKGMEKPLKEPTIADLMAPPSLYPKVYIDEPLTKVLKAIYDAYTRPVNEDNKYGQVRTALVYDRSEKFIGMVRFSDILKLIIPPFLSDSPYSSYFTGMFLAQVKVFGKQNISSLVKKQVFVDVNAPIMEAIHLLVEHKLINIPVLKDGELVGILRGRDIIVETARLAGAL